jgi:hypothetical protein
MSEHTTEAERELLVRSFQYGAGAASKAGMKLLAERDAQARRIADLEAENEKLSEQKAQLIIQAQSHALEARAQRATVHEVNQVVSGARGEKGDWNGAIPVRDRIAELTARAEKAEAKVKELEQERAVASSMLDVCLETGR